MKIIPASVPKIECFEVLEVRNKGQRKLQKMIIKRLVGIIWNIGNAIKIKFLSKRSTFYICCSEVIKDSLALKFCLKIEW